MFSNQNRMTFAKSFESSSSMTKRPSPRSVIEPIMTQSTKSLTTNTTNSHSNYYGFEDEPFDCASECRSRQTTDALSAAGNVLAPSVVATDGPIARGRTDCHKCATTPSAVALLLRCVISRGTRSAAVARPRGRRCGRG